MNDAADHPSVVNARLAARVCRQVRLNLGKLRIRQPEEIAIHVGLPFGSRESQPPVHPNPFMGLDPRRIAFQRIRSSKVPVKSTSHLTPGDFAREELEEKLPVAGVGVDIKRKRRWTGRRIRCLTGTGETRPPWQRARFCEVVPCTAGGKRETTPRARQMNRPA